MTSIGLVISAGSLRHRKMIVVQGLALGYLATQFAGDFTTGLICGAGTFIVVYFVVKKTVRPVFESA